MKSAIKTLFEQAKNQITKFNIDPAILIAVMTELVRDYIAENNLQLAFEAAKVTGNTADYRLVLEASKSKTPFTDRVGVDGMMEVLKQKHFLLNILIAAGNEEELREVVVVLEKKGYLESSGVIRVYTHLKDSAALLGYAKMVAQNYFDALAREKASGSSNSGTPSIPHYALEVFKAAKELGAEDVDQQLIEFGDKVFAASGKFEVLNRSYNWSDNDKTPEVIRAYELAGTEAALKKAAEGYVSIGDLPNAARTFSKIGDTNKVAEMVQRIASNGKLLVAVTLRAELNKDVIRAAELEKLMGTTASVAKTKVVEEIGAYLTSHVSDEPFPTSHTFWYYSDSNLDEWKGYLHTVHGLAGREDTYFCKPYPSIAKELYATENAPVIGQVHLALQKHLLVGYMLSALQMEVDGRCPDRRNRKYEHAFDAAWRTFAEGVDGGGGYNPFDTNLGLKNDPDMRPLFEEIKSFVEKENALCANNGSEHTYESHMFLRQNCPELQGKVREVYNKLTGDIRDLLVQLK